MSPATQIVPAEGEAVNVLSGQEAVSGFEFRRLDELNHTKMIYRL